MKLYPTGVDWSNDRDGFRYVYWWNWLPRQHRYLGYREYNFDGVHKSIGLWFINITWML